MFSNCRQARDLISNDSCVPAFTITLYVLCILRLTRIPEGLGYIEMLLLLLGLLLIMLNTGNTTCLQSKSRRQVEKTACLSEPMNTDNTQLGINLVTQAANFCYCFTLFSCSAPSSQCVYVRRTQVSKVRLSNLRWLPL